LVPACLQGVIDKSRVLLFIVSMKRKIEGRETKSKQIEKKKPLTVGQVIDCVITSLNHEGYGTSLIEGAPVLVRGAIPDEMVRARITFVGRRETFAEVQKVLRKSPCRLIKPACDKGSECDGCPLVQMQYKAQLSWKKQMVEVFIHGYPSLRSTPVRPVIPSDRQLAYRNSAKLAIAGKFANPLIGIYRPNTHDVVDISECPLHNPLIKMVVAAVKEGIKKGKVPIYSTKTGSGFLRYLVVRVSETENRAMVVFVTARRSFNEIHHLAKYLQTKVPEVSVVAQNINSSSGNVILGSQNHFLTREHAITDAIGNIRFLISPNSFFQINSSGARAVYEKVLEWSELSGSETILDVYCGVGGISLFLAGKAKDVIGCETVGDAVADAEKNARLNGLRNCRFEAGDAAEILDELREEGRRADVIVVNPPRKGCDEKVLRNVAAFKPKKIIYVSCSPQTLSRDLDILAELGFRTHEIQPVDMFPQTPHVENVALLVRKA
jgi:23S rRNA (uracil1939-C5)-methyltransferase